MMPPEFDHKYGVFVGEGSSASVRFRKEPDAVGFDTQSKYADNNSAYSAPLRFYPFTQQLMMPPEFDHKYGVFVVESSSASVRFRKEPDAVGFDTQSKYADNNSAYSAPLRFYPFTQQLMMPPEFDHKYGVFVVEGSSASVRFRKEPDAVGLKR